MENKYMKVLAFWHIVMALPFMGYASALGTMQRLFFDADCSDDGQLSAHWSFANIRYRIDRDCTNDLWTVVLPTGGYNVLNKVIPENEKVVLRRGERIVFAGGACKGYFANIPLESLSPIDGVPEEYLHAERLLALRFRVHAHIIVNDRRFYKDELYIIDPVRMRAWDCVNKAEERVPFPFAGARIMRKNIPNYFSTEQTNCVWRLSEEAAKIRDDFETELFRLRNSKQYGRYFDDAVKSAKRIPFTTCRRRVPWEGFLYVAKDAQGESKYCLMDLQQGRDLAMIACLDCKGGVRCASIITLHDGPESHDRYRFCEKGILTKATQIWQGIDMKGYSFPQRSVVPMQDKECEEFNPETDAEIRALLGLKPARAPLTREDVRKIVEEKL